MDTDIPLHPSCAIEHVKEGRCISEVSHAFNGYVSNTHVDVCLEFSLSV